MPSRTAPIQSRPHHTESHSTTLSRSRYTSRFTSSPRAPCMMANFSIGSFQLPDLVESG